MELAIGAWVRRSCGVEPPFFEMKHARVWRGETLALDDFNLTIEAGESLAVLGPNGAGKSTFLKLMTGEVRPEAGRGSVCKLFGEALWSLEELRHRMGVVMPEEVARFDPEERAGDAVLSSLRGAYGRTKWMRFSNADRAAAMDAMELMGVAGLAEREFGSLSSGERRRFLIARALVHQPEVLVLDEPSTALDFAASLQLAALLQQLLKAGRALILVTHHPGEIPPAMERVVLLDRGKVVADGPKKRVLSRERLETLYQVGLKVRWADGWCEVRPG